ncbi:PPK2 family polyphosphate kinase [Miniimonas arenae]
MAQSTASKKAAKAKGKTGKNGKPEKAKNGKAGMSKTEPDKAEEAKPSKGRRPGPDKPAPDKSTAAKATKATKPEPTDAVEPDVYTADPVEVTREGAKDWSEPVGPLLRPGDGFDLATFDAGATPGWDGSEKDAERRMAALGEELSELQERLYAEGRSGGSRSVLLVLQGLDTSGKGGIARHVLGMVDPQGVALRSFGVPTLQEREHHFLWRIRNALPPTGRIGLFDRSHYEDVLVAVVDELAPPEELDARYGEINDFEAELAGSGTTIVKVALVISPQEQYDRLHERLERPDKHWKFSVGDLATRAKWPQYTQAYQRVFDRTSTEGAPWHVVPADNKWFSRLVVTELLTQALRDLNLGWPVADFDVDAARAALEETKDQGTTAS